MPDFSIGIDIGSRNTKVVVLEGKNNLLLNDMFIFPTPAPTFTAGRTQMEAGPFLEELDRFIRPEVLRAAKVGINMPQTSITVMSVFLPKINKRELEFAAINEAKQKMFPTSGPEHIFRCVFFGERTVDKITKSEILVIRVENTPVNRFLTIFNERNVTPYLITPNPCVLPNILPKEAWKKDEPVLLVDMGANSINISIYRNLSLVFMRNLSLGIEEILLDIARQLQMPQERVVKAVLEKGIPEVDFDFKDKVAVAEEIMRQKYETGEYDKESSKQEINLLELKVLWQPHIERIIQELRKTFVYYKEQSKSGRIEQVFFLGGGSQIKNLIPILINNIGGGSKLVLPFSGVQIPKEKEIKDEALATPIYAGAVSLALALPLVKQGHSAVVNFLPKEISQKEVYQARRLVLLITCGVFILVMAIMSAQVFFNKMIHKKNIEFVEYDLTELKDVANQLRDMEQKSNLLSRRIAETTKIAGENSGYLGFLGGLIVNVPPQILLRGFDLLGNALKIEAQVFADYEDAARVIMEFRKNLKALGSLNNINITSLELEKISPQPRDSVAGGNIDLRLTQSQARNFSLSAEVSNK
ncbi:MAG: pilus assembly protein PilM [Candidatus Omnitrophota bacterium]